MNFRISATLLLLGLGLAAQPHPASAQSTAYFVPREDQEDTAARPVTTLRTGYVDTAQAPARPLPQPTSDATGAPMSTLLTGYADDADARTESSPTSYANNQPSPAQNQNASDPNAQPLGQAPVDNSELFLRSETVLLEPGQFEVDWGFNYVWQEALGITILPGDVLAVERVRHRQWFMPLAIRYGLTEKIQPYVNLPWGAAQLERSSAGSSDFDGDFGMGDIKAGFNYLIVRHQDHGLDVVGGLSLTAPTGSDSLDGLVVADTNSASLGNGFWAASANLNFVKSIDPAVIFGGLGYTHEFATDRAGVEIQPGEIFSYQFGVGFAINDNMTVSTLFQGAWQDRFRVDGDPVLDSSIEPFSLRFALTLVASQSCIIEPFAAFGLNEDAPNADFGIILTRRS